MRYTYYPGDPVGPEACPGISSGRHVWWVRSASPTGARVRGCRLCRAEWIEDAAGVIRVYEPDARERTGEECG